MCGPEYIGEPGAEGWDGSDNPNDIPLIADDPYLPKMSEEMEKVMRSWQNLLGINE